mmetsp:Transcript_18860/g.55307  ORF Transcript_18860/g.55307 Transcript_18860/m.55307 type:complete len:347 (+) Transcript_18860:1550-2590(+)
MRLAPCWSKSLEVSVCFSRSASSRGVPPYRSLTFTSARRPRRNSTTCVCPWQAARWMGRRPFTLAWLTLTPEALMMRRAFSSSPLAQAAQSLVSIRFSRWCLMSLIICFTLSRCEETELDASVSELLNVVDDLDDECIDDLPMECPDCLDRPERAVMAPSYCRMALSMMLSSSSGKALSTSRYSLRSTTSTLHSEPVAVRAFWKWRMPKTKGTSPSVSPGPAVPAGSGSASATSASLDISTMPDQTMASSLHASPARKRKASSSMMRSRMSAAMRFIKPLEVFWSSVAWPTMWRYICTEISICMATGRARNMSMMPTAEPEDSFTCMRKKASMSSLSFEVRDEPRR